MLKWLIVVFLSFMVACSNYEKKQEGPVTGQILPKYSESDLITNTRQLTLSGKRAGEGYFSADDELMIYQSEKEPENPFYQIYIMDMKNGDSWRVSPGVGKTTCSWIHPSKKKVLFASTHEDPRSLEYQNKELDFRKSGKKRRYSWDYDKNYELYSSDLKGKRLKKLTNALGYDAEGSYSPDGQWIAFASNRHAYSEKLSEKDKKAFELNASYMMDIYIMKSNGTKVKRLTTSKGYDGGPFFSPDGKKIVWRRFSENGHTAEVFTMNVDGSDQKQITRLGKLSWTPYYHPSGDYIIFATNQLGYHNFELYMVDAEGKNDPVRVSFSEGFDGLPVFTNDGQRLSWSSQRTSDKKSQIFMANWNDAFARKLLKLPPQFPKMKSLSPEINISDTKKYIEFLASPSMKGRFTGSQEEKIYTQKIATLYKDLGLKPVRGAKDFTHSFEFSSGGKLGEKNQFHFQLNGSGTSPVLNKDWIPLSFSKTGYYQFNDIIFAGYGLNVPEGEGFEAFDSYYGLDVKNKWVMVFRYIPEDLKGKKRSYFHRYSQLRFKVTRAEELGAKGVIIVSGPSSKSSSSLIRWKATEASQSASLPVISISDEMAEKLFEAQNMDIKAIQTAFDQDPHSEVKKEQLRPKMKPWSGLSSHLNIEIFPTKTQGINIVGRLIVPGARRNIMIGAHADHLGEGRNLESSLADSNDLDLIHYGADDNASGVSGVIELAHYFSKNKKALKANLYFALWSAEELGTIGSQKYIEKFMKKNKLSAYINMDMIGRMNETLYIQGVGSSKNWPQLIEKSSFQTQVLVKLQNDPYLPTDSMPFYLSNVPGVSAFTGVHEDYHTPRDKPEKLNYEGLVKTIEFIKTLTLESSKISKMDYQKVKRKEGHGQGRRSFRIYLGTIPDYASEGVKGLKLSGVVKGGPAELAGLKKGDLIVEFSGKKINNIYDYMYILESAKVGVSLPVVIMRDGKKLSLNVIPKAK